MSAARIYIAMTGEDRGLLIAVIPPPIGFHSGPTHVVGDVACLKADGKPDLWQAWLWPVPGGQMHVSQSVEAITADDKEQLGGKARKRARAGYWWEKGIL